APGRRVLDLGSAPGGWAQVALARGCRVVGVDLLEMAPLEGAVLLQGDVFDPALLPRLLDAFGGPADVLLSDLAPSSSGQRAVDRLRAEAAAEEVFDLLEHLLAPSGSAVIKLMRGAEGKLAHQARRRFAKTKLVRPEATRRDSSEIYLVGLGHVGARAGDDES
ncbi:MAG: SAM-dependent methyltransferase, partial [Geminicoccales bacterium]